MNLENAKIEASCPRSEIAAYIDGELSPREEMDLELHFVACQPCTKELNEQKKLLCALDIALDDKNEIELPENFTKIVVANAESNVQGLRCPRERTRALFVCATLFLMVIFGLGAETSKTVESLGNIGEQFLAVGSFFAHFVHDATLVVTVFLRSLCLQFVFKSAVTVAVLGISFILSLLIFSRLLLRYREL
jgi:anti-sigma factor RsiW